MTSSIVAHRDGHIFIRQVSRHEVRFPLDGRLEELGQADEDGESVQWQDVAVQNPGPRVAARLPVVILHRMPINRTTLLLKRWTILSLFFVYFRLFLVFAIFLF